ncbi:hypothetical protein [Desulfogranum marinum]|uniref:hypothetical protein n=1 Tax=Desulfogranum marinum TaxID=453220 RepID=UPI001963C247|nr:hypothetical protein [Desulfogranum marinum]MBM9514269.1 hypothetical protein [Desulfogranum marinum]
MNVTRSTKSQGILGITGHAGAGHVHSHSGFVQDDTAGFAVIACLLRRAFPVCTTISSVEADIDTGIVTVKTQDGGTGKAKARRGITPYEATLARLAIGLDAIYSQSAAFAAFGRIYGQGCLELPVALQIAICLAVIDTFEKRYHGSFICCPEGMPGKLGRCIGAVIEINGIPVSVMGILNASEGGLGPDEDLEGNIMLGEKSKAMKELGLDRLPTIIIESKAYVPAVCKTMEENAFWVRINKDVDNKVVYDALVHGAAKAELKCIASDTAYSRGTGEMAEATRELGQKIASLGNALANAETSQDKVRIIGELAILVSEDAGGITFMSSKLHDVVGGGGLLPGSSAVLSMAISETAIRIWKIPAFTAHDSDMYLAILEHAVPLLAQNIQEALLEVETKYNFNEGDFSFLLNPVS